MASADHNKRVQILHAHQHLLLHDASAFAYFHPAAPGVNTLEAALDWLFNVIYPKTKGQVATPADLPTSGNSLFDFYTVQNDGDGKAAAYRWLQYEGESAPSWKKVYDFDWGTGTILSHFIQQTQDLFVIRGGASSRDAAGNIITGTFAGQRVYGGALANENLTLEANSGDGTGPTTGFVQVNDNFRPVLNETFNSGTATNRWLKTFQREAEIGTATLVDDAVNNEFDFTTTRPTINFGSSSLLTTGSGSFSAVNISGLTTWVNGLDPSVTQQLQGLAKINQETRDPNGVVNPSDITISYSLSTRTVTLTGTFDIYVVGKRYTITGPVSATHADTIGNHFFYFNSSGVFVTSTTPWDLTTTAQIVLVAYNNTAATTYWAGPEAILLEERHGISMDGMTHQSLHNVVGTYVKGLGFALNGTYSVATGSGGAGPNTYGVDSGTIVDEDIELLLPSFTEGDGITPTYPVFYRTGLGGQWRWFLSPLPYIVGSGNNIVWNQNSGGTWSLTEITSNGRYMNMYLCAVPFHSSSSGNNYRFIWVIGQQEYTSLAAAQGESFLSSDLSGLPFQEFVALWQVTMRRENAYTASTGRTRIEATTRIIGTRSSLATIGTTPSNHNALSNRSDPNSHPAAAVGVDTNSFNNSATQFLSAADTNVQLALQTLSGLRASANIAEIFINNNTITTNTSNSDLVLSSNGSGVVSTTKSFLPTSDGSLNLGSSSNRFNNLFLSGGIGNGTNSISMTTLLSLRDVLVNADPGDVLIYDGSKWVADVADSEVKHELISGLHSGASIPSTNPDAGHPQFVMLAGRSGGQTVQGGTAASENLVLESTSHATKGVVATKDHFVPDTTAVFSGGWLGTDLGSPTRIWRDLYMTGEARGFRLENVSSNPPFNGQTPGRMWWNTTTKKVVLNTGSQIVAIGGGGGGASLVWASDDVSSPEEGFYNGQKAYIFTKSQGQRVKAIFKVPATYTSGDELRLKVGVAGSVASGNVAATVTVGLQGTGTLDSPQATASSNQSVAVGALNKIYVLDFPVTNSSGQVGSVAVGANDILTVEFTTHDSGFSSSGVMYMLPSSCEVHNV